MLVVVYLFIVFSVINTDIFFRLCWKKVPWTTIYLHVAERKTSNIKILQLHFSWSSVIILQMILLWIFVSNRIWFQMFKKRFPLYIWWHRIAPVSFWQLNVLQTSVFLTQRDPYFLTNTVTLESPWKLVFNAIPDLAKNIKQGKKKIKQDNT